MAASKVRLQYQTSDAFKDHGEVTLCKYVSGFPELRTYGEEYQDRWNAIKCKMEQDKIPGWKGGTAAQSAAIQAYALATPPVEVRAALWQTDRARGERFTECLDFLQKDRAKKHKFSLRRLWTAQPVPGVAPITAPVVAPVAVGNDPKLPQTIRIACAQCIVIWLRQVLWAHSPAFPG